MGAVRRFHNDIKKYLYGIGCQGNLLDIGAGRGGDLAKYNQAVQGGVVAVDLHDKDLNELMSRYSSMDLRNIHFLDTVRGDMSARDFAPDFSYAPASFRLVSCQFALHYAFKTPETIQNMCYNIDKYLAPGGHFITTFLDGSTLYKALETSQGSIDFGYITIRSEYPLASNTLTSIPINVTIKSISDTPYLEYLVDFSTLKNVLEHYNIHVVESRMFSTLPGSRLSPADMKYSGMHRYVIFQKQPLPPPPPRPGTAATHTHHLH